MQVTAGAAGGWVFQARRMEIGRALNFTSEVAILEAVREFVREATSPLAPSEVALYQMELVVVEAVTNVIEHAYAGCSGQPIALEIRAQGRLVELTLRDRGRSFDLVAHPDPDVAQRVAQGQRGGLGVFLMRQLLDNLALEREAGWNVMRMRFKLDP